MPATAASPLFNLGQTVMTRAISALIAEERLTMIDIIVAMRKHVTGDWSEMSKHDAEMNREGVKPESIDRIMTVLTIRGTKIYIITEWDRSVTTVLLPEDY